MYTLTVRSHFMIAHSLRGELFGPAQRLHGATYVVDLELRAAELAAEGVVADIGRASETLAAVLAELNYRNLDELPEMTGLNTTTEVLARTLFDRLAARIGEGALGPATGHLCAMRVTLHESPVARASYEGPLTGPGTRP